MADSLSPRLFEKSSQDGIEESQRKQSLEKGLCKDMSEEGQCMERPKKDQRKTTGDRPMSKRANDRSMQTITQAVRKLLARLKHSVPLFKARSGFSILTEECLTFRMTSPSPKTPHEPKTLRTLKQGRNRVLDSSGRSLTFHKRLPCYVLMSIH